MLSIEQQRQQLKRKSWHDHSMVEAARKAEENCNSIECFFAKAKKWAETNKLHGDELRSGKDHITNYRFSMQPKNGGTPVIPKFVRDYALKVLGVNSESLESVA